MSAKKFKAGQEVWLTIRGREPEVVTVARAGTKYAYAAPNGSGYERQFDVVTGLENVMANASRIETTEMRDERLKLHAASQRARFVGLRFDHGVERTLTADQLERLALIMEEGR